MFPSLSLFFHNLLPRRESHQVWLLVFFHSQIRHLQSRLLCYCFWRCSVTGMHQSPLGISRVLWHHCQWLLKKLLSQTSVCERCNPYVTWGEESEKTNPQLYTSPFPSGEAMIRGSMVRTSHNTGSRSVIFTVSTGRVDSVTEDRLCCVPVRLFFLLLHLNLSATAAVLVHFWHSIRWMFEKKKCECRLSKSGTFTVRWPDTRVRRSRSFSRTDFGTWRRQEGQVSDALLVL